MVKNKTCLEHSNSNPTGKVRFLVGLPGGLGVLDQLLEALIVDIVYRPLRNLVPWKVAPKLHVEQSCATCAAKNQRK